MSCHPVMTRNVYTAIMISTSQSCILLVIIIMDPETIPPSLMVICLGILPLFSYLKLIPTSLFVDTMHLQLLSQVEVMLISNATPLDVCGSQTTQAYSKCGLTSEMYRSLRTSQPTWL